MTIYFVRHAKAGSRSNWDGEDVDRPLSNNGWHQARLVGAKLAKRSPSGTASTAVTPVSVVVPWLRIWALMVYVSPTRQIS